MKIDRLIGILSLLQQREKITAKELSEKFEVSIRTINRDIEHLTMAGIPVVTFQGKGGGISIMDGYKIDRTLISREEMNSIITGLKGLDSISRNKKYKILMEKLSAENSEESVKSPFIIDLSGWDGACLSKKIDIIKTALSRNKKIQFKYFSPKGESIRTAEPENIIFQWSSWYIWAYCTIHREYRMFKLTRMTELKILEEDCENKEKKEFKRTDMWDEEMGIYAEVKFDESVKWRLVDELGIENIEEGADGSILLKRTWTDLNSFLTHILSFGDKAEIIRPEKYRQIYLELLEKIKLKYNEKY